MILQRKLLIICFFSIIISCSVASQENPTKMFSDLFEKYKKMEFESKRLDGGPDDGMGISIFDINKKLSKDKFCQFNLYSSLGQTQYLIYNKNGENIWYIYKKVLFYEEPYKLENAEIHDTYFKFINNLIFVFNDKNGQYDIQADTNKYPAIVDVDSLAQLVEIVSREYLIARW